MQPPAAMKMRRRVGMWLVGLAACTAGCAAEAEEDETGAAALATPREEKKTGASARLEEVRLALQKATKDDFGDDLASTIRTHLDGLRKEYATLDADPEATIHSFMTGTKKAYIVETRPGGTKQFLYVYDAVGDKSALGNWFLPESRPVPLGKCTGAPKSTTLECKSVAEGAKLL